MVKWGIIASGGIARRRTLPAMKYVENARIIAIMDKDKNVLKEISEEYLSLIHILFEIQGISMWGHFC